MDVNNERENAIKLHENINENIKHHYTDLANAHNLAFISLNTLSIDKNLLTIKNRRHYMRLQAIPIAKTNNTITIATANPEEKNRTAIYTFFKNDDQQNINLVVTSIHEIIQVLAKCFHKEDTYYISNCRNDRDRFHSASYVFTKKQKIIFILLFFSIAFGFIQNWTMMLLWFNVFLATGTAAVMIYKFSLTTYILRHPLKNTDAITTISDQNLPIYTILIALLREKEETIIFLTNSLSKFDYPKEKLDIKLLLEADDTQTLGIIERLNLPWYFQTIIVPPGKPLTKPRACNYGLQYAQGDYLTTYDAEDSPDPKQLKIALQHFLKADKKVVCLQAALNFYNDRDNLLTKFYTIEYTHWFDQMIPAISSLDAPVPLGGTSNHFKIEVLYELDGWDPYIGTEDAEIGMRLCRAGYKVQSINSTTYEEANVHFLNWLRQRTRWNKGYLQTYLSNMRDPINMLKQIGLRRFLHFQFFIGGNIFSQLSNLPLWMFFILSSITHQYDQSFFPQWIWYLSWYNFIIGNLILFISQCISIYGRGLYRLLIFMPFTVFYWLMLTLPGYYAMIELFVRPSYWYKTEHGFSNARKAKIERSL